MQSNPQHGVRLAEAVTRALSASDLHANLHDLVKVVDVEGKGPVGLPQREAMRNQVGQPRLAAVEQTYRSGVGVFHPARELDGESLAAGCGRAKIKRVGPGNAHQDYPAAEAGDLACLPNRILAPGGFERYVDTSAMRYTKYRLDRIDLFRIDYFVRP
jgi:hypothetical protein